FSVRRSRTEAFRCIEEAPTTETSRAPRRTVAARSVRSANVGRFVRSTLVNAFAAQTGTGQGTLSAGVHALAAAVACHNASRPSTRRSQARAMNIRGLFRLIRGNHDTTKSVGAPEGGVAHT